MIRNFLFLFVVGAIAAGAGWLFTELVLEDEVKTSSATPPLDNPDNLIGQMRPEFTLGSTTGAVLNAADFDGDVLLINFWATWCTPCREEMPMLSALHQRLSPQGFKVLGIALDDVQQAREFVEQLNIRYPNMVGGADVMAVGVVYGNRSGMLPYSVLVDRAGIIQWTSLGELDGQDLENRIKELL